MPFSLRNAAKRPSLRILAGAILILFTAFLCLSLVPALFGKDVGAGFASVDRNVCVLGPDGSAEILVGGDSRAKMMVNPLVLDSITGRRTINVAELVHFGGDLPTLVNVLRKYPRVLASGPVLILSVSAPGLNDLDLKGITASAVLNWTPRDHARVALNQPGRYIRFMTGWYFPFLKRHILHKIRGTGFTCEAGMTLPRAQMEERGFRPDTSHFKPALVIPHPDGPVTRSRYYMNGARLRMFDEGLAWLAASPAKAIVLYQAPMIPGWADGSDHAVHMEIEAEFTALVSGVVARHPKVRFLDFVHEPLPELEIVHFADNYHLNRQGSQIFTRRLGEYLMREGL